MGIVTKIRGLFKFEWTKIRWERICLILVENL